MGVSLWDIKKAIVAGVDGAGAEERDRGRCTVKGRSVEGLTCLCTMFGF